MGFEPDLREIRFAIKIGESADGSGPSQTGDDYLFDNILNEAGRFAEKVFAPLNRTGDSEGCRLVGGKVHVPSGFAEAYRRYAAAGWPGLELPESYGGQNAPARLAVAVAEIFNTANMALTMGMMPIAGALKLLDRFGTPKQKEQFIPRIVGGEATVTMAITEPGAGSDVGAIRTAARRNGGGYSVHGQKSLITFGDHDMTRDVVHLVLARSPDGSPGTKGLSLFIVPKLLTGRSGSFNDISCISLEKKMGLRGSPTATLVFGERGEGADAELLGRENAGLEQMFVLMNRARINVAVFGVSSAEGARQEAVQYARTRIQGRDSAGSPVAIIYHPDVRRMLMSMTARTEAARYLAYYTASLLDQTNAEPAPEANARLELLTPITKAWCTETAFEVTSLGVQIHGGLGYSEESACCQYFREGRVHMIYEGTTGVQANDLIFRKILRDKGLAARAFLSQMQRDVAAAELNAMPVVSLAAQCLQAALSQLANLIDWLLARSPADDVRDLQANSANFLIFFGTCAASWLSLRAALYAAEEASRDFADAKAWNALFMMQQVVPPAGALAETLRSGSAAVLQMKA